MDGPEGAASQTPSSQIGAQQPVNGSAGVYSTNAYFLFYYVNKIKPVMKRVSPLKMTNLNNH